MKKTRVEILKNDTWVQLVLKEDKIKYNTLSNKIGNFEQRRISHSNTFALPYVSENIIALDINVFSPVLLAQALNKKYPARYFVRDKLVQRGFLVINNTLRGEINVNFIDQALTITDEWGRITFKQLLLQLGNSPGNFPKSVISTNFMNVINILKEYNTNKTTQIQNSPSSICLGDDPSIEGKEIFIARYPNLLNSIGSKFNIDSEGVRKLDGFNPFQSRPIFSIFGFIYIACQAFGYRLRLDPSVDFNLLRDTYLTSKAIEESTPLKDSLIRSQTSIIPVTNCQWWGYTKKNTNRGRYEHYFRYPDDIVTVDPYGKKVGVASYRPEELYGYQPSHMSNQISYQRESLQNQNIVVQIEPTPFVGSVYWSGAITRRTPDDRFIWREIKANSIWLTNTNQVIESNFHLHTVETNAGDPRGFSAIGDKSQLDNPPPGANIFIGLTFRVTVEHTHGYWDDIPQMVNMHFTEDVLPKNKGTFDSYGQFLQNKTNLLDLAPDSSVKELLANVLQQQGLLLFFEKDSEGTQNIVKLATYGSYRDRVAEARAGQSNKFVDWSKYHQKLIPPLFNTDYGTQYGEVNEISLSNPFPGNAGRIQISTDITTKGFQTKLVPFVQNQTKALNDVTAVNAIINTVPYFEYTLESVGLVRCEFNEFLEGARLQYNAQSTTSGTTCSPLAKLSNVIYSNDFIPIGIKEWYYLVDVAVRAQATFLLPISVIRNLDISLPVYIESLGGFYIIEEVEEYIDNVTLVKVNLIKLPL